MTGSILFDRLESHLNLDSIGLTLDNFYHTLNQDEKHLEEYDSECESLLNGNQHFTYKRLCSILLRFLKTSRPISDKNVSAYDDCILFNYWMYNEIARRKRYNYLSKVVPAFGELQAMWNSLIYEPSKKSYYNKCKPDFKLPQQDDWKERKQLYDYCVNSGTIVQTANAFTKSCKDIYTYIKGKAHLYKHFEKYCPSENENQCPKFYIECKKYHPDILLKQLDCYNEMHKEEPAAAEKVLSVKQHPELPAGDTFSSDGSQSQRENTPPLIKTGDVLLGVVVTSMTSGALYKFTPLGNMLRNRFGWNSNMRNFNGGDNGLFDYASGSFNPYSGGAEEHYIGYHQA